MIQVVYVFDNQMVMVFDQNGQQLPDYQGPIEAVAAKILTDATKETQFYCGLNWQEVRAIMA